MKSLFLYLMGIEFVFVPFLGLFIFVNDTKESSAKIFLSLSGLSYYLSLFFFLYSFCMNKFEEMENEAVIRSFFISLFLMLLADVFCVVASIEVSSVFLNLLGLFNLVLPSILFFRWLWMLLIVIQDDAFSNSLGYVYVHKCLY